MPMPMQGMWVQSLVQEDSTDLWATKPMNDTYWAHALEPVLCNKRSRAMKSPRAATKTRAAKNKWMKSFKKQNILTNSVKDFNMAHNNNNKKSFKKIKKKKKESIGPFLNILVFQWRTEATKVTQSGMRIFFMLN